MNRIRRIRNLRVILKDILNEQSKEDQGYLRGEACTVLRTIVNNADYSTLGDGLDVVESEKLDGINELLEGTK